MFINKHKEGNAYGKSKELIGIRKLLIIILIGTGDKLIRPNIALPFSSELFTKSPSIIKSYLNKQ